MLRSSKCSPKCSGLQCSSYFLFFLLLIISPHLPHARHDRRRVQKQPAYSHKCKPRCDEIEAESLRPMIPCNKWRRSALAQGQPVIGDICTDAFFDGFRAVCEEACNAKAKDDDGVLMEAYKRPRVARCTGLGAQTKIESCKDGYFGGVDQTLLALGMAKKGEEEKKIVIGKKKAKVREEIREESSSTIAQLKPMAEAQKAQAQNIDTYLEFPHSDGNTHTIELHKNEPLIDAVTHFCRDILKESENAGGCAREVMMYFRIHFPEKIRGHE
ncbi:hypothetical protein TL16_g02108 [Triparma laevis f. inornata]|uniref:Uncharacterized protein n=1 Tax=Triparma laevis f. inornata TaxID=1714386 RepID=A0A9W6ZQ40_9STRA|nr:hypothetical protein TL16_g02108 [Triparma laevis f. inornata]